MNNTNEYKQIKKIRQNSNLFNTHTQSIEYFIITLCININTIT